MQDLESTVGGWQRSVPTTTAAGQVITVFAANLPPVTYNLGTIGKAVITFGRDNDNDIVIPSNLVSRHHGRFVNNRGKWYIEDIGSTNGLTFNYHRITVREICDGDFIRIDDSVQAVAAGVLMVISASDSNNKWNTVQTFGARSITIGRDTSCNIVLPHVSVSKIHAIIKNEGGQFFIYDNNSTNGVLVNDRRIVGKVRLGEKDIITITNSKLIFTSSCISYCTYRNGISVDAADVVIERKAGSKKFITCNHVSLNIKPGELVAIIGGSGAGKSTVLNAMSGYLEPAAGNVYINGVDLYKNFESLKKLVGYVPQQDIVYDNLTLHDMLLYTAKLRLPEDISPAEREACIARAIELVELTEKRDAFIKALSGGQKKRASIAVELLSDPNLMFLDEPSSGLDPGTERSLMMSLRKMADNGKTVILVTHSTLQLKLCDKIVFMGKGGNLTFYGNYDEALKFFGVDDIVDVYNLITEDAPTWAKRYAATTSPRGISSKNPDALKKKNKIPRLKQLAVLCGRYAKLVFNDRQRLILLLIQAPLLALLISFVADDTAFVQFEMTQNLLFALSCCAFWVGMLNSIQEICKERNIMKREYMTGLSLTSYITSKVLVLGFLCLVQSALISGVFTALVVVPNEGFVLTAFLKMLITTFLAAISATGMGLFVSSLFSNPDRAMTVAPILLMPQILFSGIIFTLDGAAKYLSWLTVCRWSMGAYGAGIEITGFTKSRVANEAANCVNDYVNGANEDLMPMLQYKDPSVRAYKGQPMLETVEGKAGYSEAQEEIFGIAGSNTDETLIKAWLIMLALAIIFIVIARIVIGKVGKEKN